MMNDEYFEYLKSQVVNEVFRDKDDYDNLLLYLHNTRFYPVISDDANRISDGLYLRRIFASKYGMPEPDIFNDSFCSVLELIISVSNRISDILYDPNIGEQDTQWIWMMLRNLGLSHMTNEYFEEEYVSEVLNRFISRNYDPNGAGGLFIINDPHIDMANEPIWRQMCLWCDTVV